MEAFPASLPYVERILEARERGGSALSRLFERFVHWGYWDRPNVATLDHAELVLAMERMNSEVLAAAKVAGGQALLDVGCGFGGTLSAIMDLHRGMRLVGLSNDARQLGVARQTASPRNDCTVELIEADACALPFADIAFQRVVSLESIFHFPSRAGFLKEAGRVLEPGGLLALTDLIPTAFTPGAELTRRLGAKLSDGYGTRGKGWTEGSYSEMATAAGLEIVIDRDITEHTLPTYPIVIAAFRESEAACGPGGVVAATELLERLSRIGLLQYRLLVLAKRR